MRLTYDLRPQFVIHIFGKQSGLGVEIWQHREIEFLSLHGQICPLAITPQRLCRARLSVLFREDDILGIHHVSRCKVGETKVNLAIQWDFI
jgi:hypothetical protein